MIEGKGIKGGNGREGMCWTRCCVAAREGQLEGGGDGNTWMVPAITCCM